jgi:hypothetical protein
MRRLDKIKNIEEANKRLLGERFDIDSYEETSNSGYDELNNYLNTLNLTEDEKSTIMNIAESWADDMWREGAQGGFADK